MERLLDICDIDGKHFSDKKENEKYIVSYFKNIYTKPSTEPENLEGCIEDFLGPVILDHPVVKNSILTAQEKNRLDRPFDILELDEAIKKANLHSAAGIDGLSTRFIAKFSF